MNHLFAFNPYNAFPFKGKVMMLRQGLEPVYDPTISVNWNASASNTRCIMKASPDMTKGVITQSQSGSNFTNYFEVTSATDITISNTTSSFSGEVNDCFAGNDYYGFAGLSTSYINAFRWSDNSLVTLDKTDLGTVYSVSLHPINGYLLAVTHSTTPYLRVYDLRDGTFIIPSTASQTNAICSWTGDGSNVVLASETSPYVFKYDNTLATKTSISTSFTYSTNSSWTSGPFNFEGAQRCMPHPTKSTAAIIANANNISPYLYEVDCATDTITDIVTGSSNAAAMSAYAYDPKFNKFYTMQGPSTYTTDCFRRYNGTTYAEEDMTSASALMTSGAVTFPAAASFAVISANTGTITGTVRDISNTPVARTVRAYRRSDGLLVAQTVSDGTTGDYTLITPTSSTEAYDVQFLISPGELLNDLFYARSTPAAVSGAMV